MKRTKSGMARVNTLFQIFLFPLSRETRSNTFLKNTSTPRHNQLLWAYFLYSHHGMSDQNRWHSRKASKIKASSGFWGRFSKPQKIQFYRWHSVFGVKKRFSGSEIEKNLAAFFRFWKSTNRIPKRRAIEKFYRTVYKRTVVILKSKHIWKINNLLTGVEFCCIAYCDMIKNQKLQRLHWWCISPLYKGVKKWRNIYIFQQI